MPAARLGVRGRLLVALVAPTAIGVVLAGLLVHTTVARRGEAELAARLVDAEHRLEGVLLAHALRSEDLGRILTSPDHAFAGPLIAERAKGGGRLSALARVDLSDRIDLLVKTLGLTDLAVLDGMPSTPAPPLQLRAVGPRGPELIRRGVYRGEADRSVVVTFGRRLDEDLIQAIEARGLAVRILDATQAAIGKVGSRPDQGPTRILALPKDGPPVAHLELTASRVELARLLRDLTTGSVALGALAIACAAGLALALARRQGQDVVALTAGADQRAAAQMATELRDSRARLRQAERLAAWQEIARALAHELKNPLTPIRISVETLRKAHAAAHPTFPELFDESTRTILEEVRRMEKSLREFAEFARLPRRERQLLALNEVVAGALALYKGAVRVVEELAPNLPPIDADRDQLTQVILNLIENARDAVAQRGIEQTVGRIHVTTRAGVSQGASGPSPGVVLEVRDNGPGFDDAIAEQLFTPYFTTKAQGTGLGLAIAQRIVVEHGGAITAHGTPGEGACFTVELPLRGGVTDTVPVMPPRSPPAPT